MKKGKYKTKLLVTFSGISIIVISAILILFSWLILSTGHLNSKELIQVSIATKTDSSIVNTSIIFDSMKSLRSIESINLWKYGEKDFYFQTAKLHRSLRQIASKSFTAIYTLAVTDSSFNYIVAPEGSFTFENYVKYINPKFTAQVKESILQHFDKSRTLKVLPIYSENQLTDICYTTYDEVNDLIYFSITPISSYVVNIPNLNYVIVENGGIAAYNNLNESNTRLLDEAFSYVSRQELQQAKTNYSFYSQGRNDLFYTQISNLPFSILYQYNYFQNMGYQNLIYIFVCFGILLAVSLLALKKLLHMVYSPITNTLKNVERKDYLANNFDEFAIINENVQNANRLNEELIDTINQRDSFAKQNYYRELLFSIPDCDCPLSYKEMEAEYCVALLEFRIDFNKSNIKDLYLNLQKNVIYVYIEQLLKTQSIYCLSIRSNAVAIVMQTDSQQKLIDIINDILSLEDITCNMSIAVSSVNKTVMKLNLSYEEANNILEYKYTFAENEILTSSNIKATEGISYYYPLSRENRLIHTIVTGSSDALKIYDKTISDNLSQNLSTDVLRNFTYALINTIMRCFQELKTTPEKLIGKQIDVVAMYSDQNFEQIWEKLRNYLLDIISARQQNNISSDEALYNKMLEYIYKNYNDDIMLTDVAQHCKITAPYCSMLFKKYNFDNYKNFLNKYRIQQACKILSSNPEIKIQDLSLMVGFNSANSFIRVFGKFMNKSPKAYLDDLNYSWDNE